AGETISQVISFAAPQTADAARNHASEIWSTRLRPTRSRSFPHSGVVAAAVITYAEITHETSLSRPRSEAIVGSAVARMVWSSTAGSIARTIAAKAMVRERSVVVTVGWVDM